MKLLTHNMLMSPGTKNGYPLGIHVEKLEEIEAEANLDFMARMVEKIDYNALLATLSSLEASGVKVDLPAAVPEGFAENEPFLLQLHHALMEIEILEGHLICPETDKQFPIKEGIPSML